MYMALLLYAKIDTHLDLSYKIFNEINTHVCILTLTRLTLGSTLCLVSFNQISILEVIFMNCK